MKLALCDDDRRLVSELKPIIYAYANTHRFELVIDEYYCGEALLKADTVYDMVFLDHHMNGLNGLETAKKLRDKNMNCTIIFMTSYPHFVYDAFEVNAFRFFKKPLQLTEIYAALDDYFNMYGNDYPILLRHDRETVEVNTRDIVFLEAMNKDCLVHLRRERFRCPKTMAIISKAIPQNHFFKIHRAFIVNFNYITRYTSQDVFFKNGEKAPISRNYLAAFKVSYRGYSDFGNLWRAEAVQ